MADTLGYCLGSGQTSIPPVPLFWKESSPLLRAFSAELSGRIDMLLLALSLIALVILYFVLKLVFNLIGAILGTGIVQAILLWFFIIPTGVLIVAMVLQGVFTGEIN
jgi:uncharacterized membrane protein (DUF485 family)